MDSCHVFSVFLSSRVIQVCEQLREIILKE